METIKFLKITRDASSLEKLLVRKSTRDVFSGGARLGDKNYQNSGNNKGCL